MSLGLDLSDLPPGVVYLENDVWGLTHDEALRRGLDRQPNGLDELFVHHTAGQTPDLTTAVWDDDPATWMRHLDTYARDGKGYKAVDYSFGIHAAPGINVVTIVEGRGEYYPAATSGRNTRSKAVVFAGNFHPASGPTLRRHPHQVELDAARWLNTALRRAGVLGAAAAVWGHRDNPSCVGCTSCPGDWLHPHVPYIATPWPTTPPAPAPEPEPPSVDPGADHMAILEVVSNPDAKVPAQWAVTPCGKWWITDSRTQFIAWARSHGYDPKVVTTDAEGMRRRGPVIGPRPTANVNGQIVGVDEWGN